MDNNNLPQKDLIKKIVGDARGAVGIRLCAIGVDLGIFENLAKHGPATSQELADRMNPVSYTHLTLPTIYSV